MLKTTFGVGLLGWPRGGSWKDDLMFYWTKYGRCDKIKSGRDCQEKLQKSNLIGTVHQNSLYIVPQNTLHSYKLDLIKLSCCCQPYCMLGWVLYSLYTLLTKRTWSFRGSNTLGLLKDNSNVVTINKIQTQLLFKLKILLLMWKRSRVT